MGEVLHWLRSQTSTLLALGCALTQAVMFNRTPDSGEGQLQVVGVCVTAPHPNKSVRSAIEGHPRSLPRATASLPVGVTATELGLTALLDTACRVKVA
jgi:hypothetical protein